MVNAFAEHVDDALFSDFALEASEELAALRTRVPKRKLSEGGGLRNFQKAEEVGEIERVVRIEAGRMAEFVAAEVNEVIDDEAFEGFLGCVSRHWLVLQVPNLRWAPVRGSPMALQTTGDSGH